MNKTQWEEGIAAWEKVKTQAEIDMEQAELYIKAIEQKIKEIK